MLCSSPSWSVFRPARAVGGRLALDGFRLLGPAVPVAHFGRAECIRTHASDFRPLIFDGPDKRGFRSGDKNSNGKAVLKWPRRLASRPWRRPPRLFPPCRTRLRADGRSRLRPSPLKPLMVSASSTNTPGEPVKTSATWKGCDIKRSILRARVTVTLSSSDSSSMPRMAMMS